MMAAPEMRSPAPALASGKDRADLGSHHKPEVNPEPSESPADFAARFVANRFRLPLPVAAMVANLAGLAPRDTHEPRDHAHGAAIIDHDAHEPAPRLPTGSHG